MSTFALSYNNSVNKGLYFSWVNPVPLNQTVQSMYLYMTDVEQPSAPIMAREISPYLDASNQPVTNYTMTNLTAGVSYVASLLITTTNGLVYSGTGPSVQVRTTPQTPTITAVGGNGEFVISLDPSNVPLQQNSERDGFSTIQNFTIFYSDVSGTGLQVYDISNTAMIYNSSNQYIVDNVYNYIPYEVAVRLSNAYGVSGISNTVVVTPTPTPVPVSSVSAVETAYALQDGSLNLTGYTGKGIDVSFPPSPITDGENPSGYKVYREMCDASGVPISSTSVQILQFNVDASNIPIGTTSVVYTNGTYKFTDDSGLVGSLYVYNVVAVNSYGSGLPSSNSNVVLCCGLANAPTFTIDASNQTLTVRVTAPSNLNGGRFNNLYWVRVLDASGAVINTPGSVSSDPSGILVISPSESNPLQAPIVNGGSYTVLLNAITTDYQSRSLYSPVASGSSQPYQNPNPPTNLMYSNFDASGLYVGSGNLYLSWATPVPGPQASGGQSFTYTFYNNFMTMEQNSLIPTQLTANSAVLTGFVNGVIPVLTMTASVYNTAAGLTLTSGQSADASYNSNVSPGYAFGAPSAVNGLTVTTDPSSATTLDASVVAPTFNGGIPPVYYRYLVADASSGVVVLDTSANDTSDTTQLTGLTAGTLYSVTVQPFTKWLGVRYLGPVSSPVLIAPYLQPLAPTINSATTFDSNPMSGDASNVSLLDVQWTDNSANGVNITSYKIYVSTSASETQQSIMAMTPQGTAAADVTFALVNIDSLTAESSYYVYILAFGLVPTSGAPLQVYGKISAPVLFNTYTGPAAPTNLSAFANSSQGITLNWNQGASVDPVSQPSNIHIIWTTSTTQVGSADIPISMPTGTYDVSGLVIGTLYSFYVSSYYIVSEIGYPPYRVYSNLTASAQAAPYAPPSAPQNGAFTVGQVALVNAINFSWSAPATNGGANANGNGPIQYEIDLLDASNNVIVNVVGISVSPYQIISELILYNKLYHANIYAYYTVAGGSNIAKSSPLVLSDILIPSSGAPQSVTGLTATANNLNVLLTWTNVTDQATYVRGNTVISKYHLNSLGASVFDASYSVPSTDASYSDSVSNGIFYYYIVSPTVTTITYVGGSMPYPASQTQPSTQSNQVMAGGAPIIDASSVVFTQNTVTVRVDSNGAQIDTQVVMVMTDASGGSAFVYTDMTETGLLGINTFVYTFPTIPAGDLIVSAYIMIGNTSNKVSMLNTPAGNGNFV